MSIVAKVLGRVLIERIVAGTDVESIREQGFRRGRSTTVQIFVLRNIVVQEVKWNFNLLVYLCFVDYKKALDSMNRDILWEIMKCYAIPPKRVTLVHVH